MVFTIIILILLMSALLILFLPKKLEVRYAFAGKPCGQEVSEKVSISRHVTRYKCDGKNVGLSGFVPFLIKGRSLEKEGIDDHTMLYVDTKFDKTSLARYIDRIIILKIDTVRSQREHPEIEFSIKEGFKARKMIGLFRSRMNRHEFYNQMKDVLKDDNDFKDISIEELLERMWIKYSFASQYYKEDNNVIVSLTYKEGMVKDFSFHSPNFLFGIARYMKIDSAAA